MKRFMKGGIFQALVPRARVARVLAAVALAGLFAAGCKGTSEPGVTTSLTISPTTVPPLALGGTQQFTAVAKNSGGDILAIPNPTWSVSAGGGTITSKGLYTAGTTAGTFTVSVTCNGVTANATVTVAPGALATITVTPNPTLAPGATQQFTAVGKDASGNVVAITPVWSVAAGGGTIVASTGVFTAGAVAGTFTNTVVATSGGKSGTATVIVTAGPLATITVTPNPATLAPGATQQFTAVGKDAGGNVVAITPVWTVTAGGGTINAGTGLFTAGAVSGTFSNTVVATSGGKSGTATVIVSGPLATITVTPNPATVQVNTTQQFTAVGRDAGGNVVAITPVWSVTAGGGTINSGTGLFTAGAVTGTFPNSVRATQGTIFGTADVIVTAGPPPPLSLGSAANFAILAGAGIRCAISGTVSGATGLADIGSSPTLTISGFPPCTFTGSIPLPAVVATAKGDLTTAYLAAQGQVCNLNISGIDLGFYDGSTGAKTLAPGTYCFSTSAALTGTLVLTGSAAARWTFQIGSTLTANVGSNVILAGGAIPNNVTWAVGSSATLLTNAQFQGNILALQDITLQNGVRLQGRALAQVGAVDLIAGAAVIIKP